MDEAVVESDGGDRLSLSHTKEAACSSRSSRSASVKAAGAWKSRRNGYGPGETLVGHTRSGWPMKRTLKSCRSTDNHHFQQLLRPFTENEYDFNSDPIN